MRALCSKTHFLVIYGFKKYFINKYFISIYDNNKIFILKLIHLTLNMLYHINF